MKAYLTYGAETKEGFSSFHPLSLSTLGTESIEEIHGENVLEKVPDLVVFIEECYRILQKEGKATFLSPFYASGKAWMSPLTKRAISEFSLAFASKKWRDENKFTDLFMNADFDIVGSFAVEETCMQRADDAKQFWMYRYNNVVQVMCFNLVKKVPDAN